MCTCIEILYCRATRFGCNVTTSVCDLSSHSPGYNNRASVYIDLGQSIYSPRSSMGCQAPSVCNAVDLCLVNIHKLFEACLMLHQTFF